MKIIYISSSTIPSRTANSIHVMKMCQAFRQNGHDVELCAPRRPAAELHEVWKQLFEHYGIQDDFPITRLRATGWLKEYDYAVRAAMRARRSRPVLVYARNTEAATFTAWLGIPTIHEVHAPPQHRLRPSGYRMLIRGPGFQNLVTITDALKERLLDFFQGELAEERIVVLPDGVDLDRFEQLPSVVTAQHRLGLSPAPLTVGYAGHLYAGRGVEMILALASQFSQYQFLLAGGDDASIISFSERAKEMCLRNVSFLGFIPNAKLPEYLAACDVLLMPYQQTVAVSGGGDTSGWASPLKMFEYMATGRLIISSDLPVLREVLSEDNSVLCPPEDIEAWSATIQRAATDQAWRARLGSRARKDVVRYSWKRRAALALSHNQCTV